MLVGYARVSKAKEQETRAQIYELEKAGVTRIFQDKASGAKWARPELHKMLDQLRKGDIVVVFRLDRLSRSIRDLVMLSERIHAAGARVRSLNEGIDTSSVHGEHMMLLLGVLASIERGMIRERTMSGLAAAKARGVRFGRPEKLTAKQQEHAQQMLVGGKHRHADIAEILGVHRSTITRLASKIAGSKLGRDSSNEQEKAPVPGASRAKNSARDRSKAAINKI